MKKIFLLLLICLFTLNLQGQNSYYATDSTLHSGFRVIDSGERLNARFCHVKVQDSIVRFTPDQVKEYKIGGGSVYLSKRIPTPEGSRNVFLERLVNGKTNLYFYHGKNRKTYFIEKKDLPLTELPKHSDHTGIDYKTRLQRITADCPDFNAAIPFVRYTRNSLSKLLKEYNACEVKPFPHFRWGLIVGYEWMKLIPSSYFTDKYLDKSLFKWNRGMTLGCFVEEPILVSDFSLHAELRYSNHGFSISQSKQNRDIDLVANISTLKLPVLIRYTFPSNTLRPYINAGGTMAWHLRNEGSIYQATLSNDEVEISEVIREPILPKSVVGLAIGSGVEFRLGERCSFFFELRFNKELKKTDLDSMNSSNLSLTTGIIF